jgi:hypothetical protein
MSTQAELMEDINGDMDNFLAEIDQAQQNYATEAG